MFRPLRVLSLNTHKFRHPLTGEFLFDDLKRELVLNNLDLVFLQEFQDSWLKPKGGEDFLEKLADDIWPHFAYGKNAVYEKGHHGNAILSKFPITEFRNIDLSNHKLERRGLLKAKIEIELVNRDSTLQQFSIQTFCTHLDLTYWGRNRQMKILRKELAGAIEIPTLICGDFNDWNSKIFNQICELGFKEVFHTQLDCRAKTFPSFLPVLKLDSMFIKGFNIHSARVLTGSPWTRLSDHLPLLAELSLSRT